MKRLIAIVIAVMLSSCNLDPAKKASIEAADALTRDSRERRLKAHAAGTDCLVLLIDMKAALDDAEVEALHYGTGEMPVYPGGLQRFAEDRKFRAVVYRDSNESLWTYGSITRDEARSIPVCR